MSSPSHLPPSRPLGAHDVRVEDDLPSDAVLDVQQLDVKHLKLLGAEEGGRAGLEGRRGGGEEGV